MTDNLSNSVWDQVEIKTARPHRWSLGEVSVWAKIKDDTLCLANSYPSGKDESSLESPPDNITWTTWPISSKTASIKMKPVFPDRPVVVKPETSFRLPSNSKAKIFIRVPVWLKIILIGKKELNLSMIPSVNLSGTWFGGFTSGELCYWISSGMRQQTEPDVSRNHSTICPLTVVNDSCEELIIEKICLHTDGFSLFFDGVQLWSDDITVSYKGSQDTTQIISTGNPPQISSNAKRITSAKTTLKKGFAARTFASILELPGIGISSITGQ